jgi:hypothetical protein
MFRGLAVLSSSLMLHWMSSVGQVTEGCRPVLTAQRQDATLMQLEVQLTTAWPVLPDE